MIGKKWCGKKLALKRKEVARENRTVLLATKKATLPLSISFVLHSLIWLYTHVLATKEGNLGLGNKKLGLHYAAPLVV